MKNFLDLSLTKQQLKSKESALKSAIVSLIRILFLLSVGFVIIYPLFYMIVTSLQGKAAFLNSTRVWIPTDFDIAYNYTIAFKSLEYGRAFLSTFKNEVIAAAIEICSCAVVAYGLARFEFKGRRILVFVLFMTILIPDMMLIIPRAVNYSSLDFLGIGGLINKLTGIDLRLNILNSVWAFWLPSIFASGLRSGILIYIYMQFFKGLPKELEEAAWVDGAGPLRTFMTIVIPSSGVVILTVTVFALIWHWNDTYLSTIFLQQDHTLAMELANISDTIFTRLGIGIGIQSGAYFMAGSVLFISPMLIMYMIVQRWFIESIDRVGIIG